MAGLIPKCQGFTPYGYQLAPVAEASLPIPIPPRSYNRNAIRPAPWSRIHEPVPRPGMNQPPIKSQDRWGNRNAKDEPALRLPPQAYNVNAIPTNYDKRTPIPVAWTRAAARSQTAESTAGGVIEPRKDLKSIAQRVNALTQLETIEITRS